MGFVHLPSLTFLCGWYHLSGYFWYPTGPTKQHVLFAMMMLGSTKSVKMKMAMAMQNFLKRPFQSVSITLQLDVMTTHTSQQNGSHEPSPCTSVQSQQA